MPKTSDRGGISFSARSRAVASAAVAVKGLRFASMNALERGAPLTAILAVAVLQL